MCRETPYTKKDIEDAKAALLKRLEDPRLTPQMRKILEMQYNHVVNNVKEWPGPKGSEDKEQRPCGS